MTWLRIFPLFAVLASPVVAQSLSETDPSLPGNPPKLDTGITTCEDGSRWHAFTFKTIPGLPYVVESSLDLGSWTETESIYGFGQEEVIIMKQAPALPVPPPPGTYHTPPPMVRVPIAQIIMRRGVGGGLVLTWKSLDDGSSKVFLFPNLSQDAGWAVMPGYVKRWGGYDFYLCNPYVPQVPPATNPTLGPLDTAMAAAFEENFPAMNAEVAASVIRARAAPRIPAVPTDAHFWRVRVNWGLDSDLDGTPDWMELAQLFAAGAGNNLVAGPEADPFNMDANSDGIADGAQRSSDGDSIPDDLDADNTDGLIDWVKCPEYRYAMFEVPNDYENSGSPMKIDNYGQVLFTKGQWVAGNFISLGEGATAVTGNDSGSILGIVYTEGVFTEEVRMDGSYSNLLRWATVSSAPTPVTSGSFIAGGSSSVLFQQGGVFQIAPFSDYAVDGSFIADTYAYETDDYDNQVLTFQHRAKWQINPITEAITEAQVENGTISTDDSHFSWGLAYESLDLPKPTFLKSQTGQREIWSWGDFSHVTTMSSGSTIVSGGLPNLMRIKRQDFWQTVRGIKSATDVSPEGIIIKQDSKPVWMNGRERPMSSIAPEYSGNPLIVPLDISQQGSILAYDPGESCEPFYLSGMPFHLESSQAGPYGKSLGVDNVSVGSEQSGAANDRLWIMVPEGRTESILIRSAASLAHPLKLSATGVTLNGVANTTISIRDEPLTVSANAGAAAGQEVNLDIKLQSGQESLSKPIGLKLMKARTVEVAVWSIDSQLTTPARNGNPSTDYTKVPTFSPTKLQIETYLNSIYRPQVNVTFNVTIHDPHVTVRWDKLNADESPADEALKTGLDPSAEQQEITKVARDSGADINVYWVGEKFYFEGDESLAKGSSNPKLKDRNVWLFGNPIVSSLTVPEMLHTMAHEIGHVMMGEGNIGHPNAAKITGPAPLPGTRRTDRLLCKGDAIIPGSRPTVLVKGEWDAMEEWLKNRIDSKTPSN